MTALEQLLTVHEEKKVMLHLQKSNLLKTEGSKP